MLAVFKRLVLVAALAAASAASIAADVPAVVPVSGTVTASCVVMDPGSINLGPVEATRNYATQPAMGSFSLGLVCSAGIPISLVLDSNVTASAPGSTGSLPIALRHTESGFPLDVNAVVNVGTANASAGQLTNVGITWMTAETENLRRFLTAEPGSQITGTANLRVIF